MRTKIIFAIAIAFGASAHARQPPAAPGLMPAAVARPLLDQDPSVAAARAGLAAARQDAGILDQSPHEWNARLSSQRRSVESGPRYQEWNAGVERTLRLPEKAGADRNLGQVIVEEAEARYGEALHEAARRLFALSLAWMQAERGRELAGTSRDSGQDNLAAVEKRLRAGDASRLDVSLAQGELAELTLADNDARTQALVAWSRLQARFPGIERQFTVAPQALPLDESPGFWRDRILSQSDELKVAQAQFQKARAQAQRTHADRVPDPTVGIYMASEAGGRERILGVSLSMPIPGDQRNRRATRSVHAIEMTRQELELKKRELGADIASALATAQGSYESLKIAESGAAAMQENARLMQKAYTLGESDLQALLSARRQATAAAQNALTASTAAVKAYYALLIDAHLVWDMDHD